MGPQDEMDQDTGATPSPVLSAAATEEQTPSTGNLVKDTDIELSKGSASMVPEDAMSTASAVKDYMTGKVPPSRQGYANAIATDLTTIEGRKTDLLQKLQNGDQLTSSQAVGLGVLALGLLTAGGLIKGKAGIGMAGNAFNQGGQLFLAEEDKKNKAKRALGLTQYADLSKQESELVKEGAVEKNKPLDEKQAEDTAFNIKKREVDAGLVDPKAGGTTINMPDSSQKVRLESAQSALHSINKIQNILANKFPVEAQKGESWFDAAARVGKGAIASEGEQKELNAEIRGLLIDRARAKGGRISGQELDETEKYLTGGGLSSIPFLAQRMKSVKDDVASLVDNIAGNSRILSKSGGLPGVDPGDLGGTPRNGGPVMELPGASTPNPDKRRFTVDGQVMDLSQADFLAAVHAGRDVKQYATN